MKISNEQLLAEYERTKDAFYQREPYIKIQKLSISFVEMKGDKEIVKDEVLNDMKKIKESLDKGNDFEVVAQKFVDSEYEIGYEVQEFNQETARSDSRFYYEIKNEALKLKPGENSEVFEFDNRFYIIRCLEKKAMGYMDFSEVKSDVLAKTIQNSYSDRIDDMVKAAVVEINDNLYGRIEVQ